MRRARMSLRRAQRRDGRAPSRQRMIKRASARDNSIVMPLGACIAHVQLLRGIKTNVLSPTHLHGARIRAQNRRLRGTRYMAKAAAKKTAKKSAAKKPAKKSARKVVAKKATRKGAVKKASAKKTTARRTVAKKSTGKKTAAKKSAAKRAPAKRKKMMPMTPNGSSETPPAA
jgi:hypothetical protein